MSQPTRSPEATGYRRALMVRQGKAQHRGLAADPAGGNTDEWSFVAREQCEHGTGTRRNRDTEEGVRGTVGKVLKKTASTPSGRHPEAEDRVVSELFHNLFPPPFCSGLAELETLWDQTLFPMSLATPVGQTRPQHQLYCSPPWDKPYPPRWSL